jgi:Asp-tRNA(Asn)/Glu-tRNA(Gln) amidotransferase A subunit family amidase
MIDLKNLTIEKAHESMKSGQYSSRELTQAYLDVIAEKNKDIFAFIEVFDDA